MSEPEEEYESKVPVSCRVKCRLCPAGHVYNVHKVSEAVECAKSRQGFKELCGSLVCPACYDLIAAIAREVNGG